MIFEDDETLQMYVEESIEHLADIENDLLAIEDRGADIDVDIVNNVFRAAHSIKGGAGFMGLTVIKDLAHNLENVLGMIRNRDLVPKSDIISVLLKAFDRLRDLIMEIAESNDADVSEHINALIAVTTSSLPEEEQDSVTQIVDILMPDGTPGFQVSQFDIDKAKKEGKFIYLVEYDFINDIHKKNKGPLELFASLSNSGIILDSKTNLDAVGTLIDNELLRLPFILLFATIIEPDMASILFDIDPKYVHHITDDWIKGKIPHKKSEVPTKTQPIVPEIKKEETIEQDVPKPAIKQQTESQEPIELKPIPEQKPEPNIEVNIAEENSSKPVVEIKEPSSNQDVNKSNSSQKQTSLRVNVNLLDTLMTLAGELVLSRNQLLQGITAKNDRATEIASQRIDMITSELQEAIMRTRMQPISNVFNKFTRVVRDLAHDLNKKVVLLLEGKEVELDKTIIESINDPLTHLVRNSVDHGIESPEERLQAGKNPEGKVELKAFHEAGQVNIEITDDGKGLNGEQLAASAIKKGLLNEQDAKAMNEKEKISLIFLPGFSTAQKVTDVSGRGVGMDVVKTNLDKLGGIIDIESAVGKGTNIKIKLPLTLAIIPSQIISVGKERYAIPQVNLDELLRIPAAQVKDRIEKVGNAEVVRLRGMLLPLVNLADLLDIKRTYINPKDNKEYEDRRSSIADRRSKQHMSDNFDNEANLSDDEIKKRRHKKDRRYHASSAINIAVVSTGTFKYGLVVDQLRDSEEIVVKPLGRHLKDCQGYAGATIMGDGKVALILDVASLALMANLSSSESRAIMSKVIASESDKASKDVVSLLLFRNNENEQFAVPLGMVERIERIFTSKIEYVSGKRVIQYRGGSLSLHELSEVINVQPLPETEQREVIVFKITGREVGLMVTPPVDAVEIPLVLDDTTLKQPGILGAAIIGDYTTLMVDIFEIMKILNPDWFEEEETAYSNEVNGSKGTILFAEDSAFFRNQVKGFLEDGGYDVIPAEDGLVAWNILKEKSDQLDIVLTDLEMPRMDGFELTNKIKNDSKFSHFSVIALTSLASEADVAKGKAVGIDDYHIKLDREKLLEAVKTYIGK